MSDPRLCIVGAGNLSTNRIYPYIGTAGAQLVGVCDFDAEKAQRNARRWGGEVFSDMAKMLTATKPDGVIICVGPEAHAALSRVAMNMGVPVYTEKPPAPTAAEALELARLSKQTGVLCTNAFKKRYNVAYNRAKQWMAGFPPTDLSSISIDNCSAKFKNDGSLRGSFLFDFGVHSMDLITYLGGDIEQVFAFSKGLDAYAIAIRFASGAVGTLTINDFRTYNLPTEEVEITLTDGNFMTIHNSSVYRISEKGKGAEWREPPTFISAGDSGNDTGHLAEIVDFVKAIGEKRTTRSNIYESYKSLMLYEAIVRAVETGQAQRMVYETI
ncbi:MAG TPA: Gfo/Idh/MocA family oxidoreductase [Tepidisphaeraceae bacterium]|jgi:predicted dehydrogenase|nr:Gfo/Idh/MocA family oxidoreductase [Tepidisphaeraceae bacterium]